MDDSGLQADDQVLQAIHRKIRLKPSERSALIVGGHVSPVEVEAFRTEGEDPVEEGIRFVRQLRDVETSQRPAPERVPVDPGSAHERQLWLGRRLAEMAAQHPAVLAIRSNLPDTLLAVDEIAQWIDEQSERDNVEFLRKRGGGFHLQTLWYPTVSGQAAGAPIGNHGLLNELWELTRDLADDYRVTRAQAVGLVLSNQVPVVPTVLIDTSCLPAPLDEVGRSLPRDAYERHLARIKLEIDPIVPAAEVRRIYASVRRQVLGDRKIRLPDAEATALSEVALESEADPEDSSWAERLRKWNQDHPDSAYETSKIHIRRIFQRDAKRALEWLRNPWG